jgi:arsenate reductase (glutaredoxin)
VTDKFQFSLAPEKLWQAINPWTFANQGAQLGFVNINLGHTAHPEIEQKVLDEVGSYGRQLGRIGDGPQPGRDGRARHPQGPARRNPQGQTGRQGGQSGMKAIIYHNPLCGTSRKTLEILRDAGADVTVIEYLKTPPSEDELKRLYERADITPREGLRTREQLARDLDLVEGAVSDAAILEAMAQNPILIERPIVETEKGVRLCRPQDKVREIL